MAPWADVFSSKWLTFNVFHSRECNVPFKWPSLELPSVFCLAKFLSFPSFFSLWRKIGVLAWCRCFSWYFALGWVKILLILTRLNFFPLHLFNFFDLVLWMWRFFSLPCEYLSEASLWSLNLARSFSFRWLTMRCFSSSVIEISILGLLWLCLFDLNDNFWCFRFPQVWENVMWGLCFFSAPNPYWNTFIQCCFFLWWNLVFWCFRWALTTFLLIFWIVFTFLDFLSLWALKRFSCGFDVFFFVFFRALSFRLCFSRSVLLSFGLTMYSDFPSPFLCSFVWLLSRFALSLFSFPFLSIDIKFFAFAFWAVPSLPAGCIPDSDFDSTLILAPSFVSFPERGCAKGKIHLHDLKLQLVEQWDPLGQQCQLSGQRAASGAIQHP